jgi:hypothetical protein
MKGLINTGRNRCRQWSYDSLHDRPVGAHESRFTVMRSVCDYDEAEQASRRGVCSCNTELRSYRIEAFGRDQLQTLIVLTLLLTISIPIVSTKLWTRIRVANVPAVPSVCIVRAAEQRSLVIMHRTQLVTPMRMPPLFETSRNPDTRRLG